MDNKDILNRMFSSFVERRTRSSSSSYSHQSTLPPLQLRNFLHEHPTMPMLPKRSTSKVSSSNHAKQPRRTTPTSKSHAMARNSRDSVDAIATDSTPIQTPHHCDKCTKAFRQRSQLVRHYSRVHEKRKPFSCAHCDKSFASAFDRKRHVEVCRFFTHRRNGARFSLTNTNSFVVLLLLFFF